jgi:two-component system NarL family sensor kinase
LRAVNEIKEKYEGEQKEKIIAEKELQIEAQKYQRAIILGIFITALLTLLVILTIIRSKNRSKLQEEKQLRLHTIVQTQEEIQQRIARDLHDGLVQVLGAARMSLESVHDDSDPVLLKKQMLIASGIMDEAVTEARSLSHQVLPYSLLKGGLVEALEELLSRSFEHYMFNKKSDHLDVRESDAINIYRIVQELVNNVRKHAQATKVILTLTGSGREINLAFEDNGNGFNAMSPAAGVGLSNMKTRAELMGGTLVFHSAFPQGTRVELTIPQ